jgi:hypothetical protein
MGVGTSNLRYRCDSSSCAMVKAGEPMPRYLFAAPYGGVVVSAGSEVVQMFVGLRAAASETFVSKLSNLTLYPVFAYGIQARPTRAWVFFLEADLAGGITVADTSNSALILYPSAGISYTFDKPFEGSATH